MVTPHSSEEQTFFRKTLEEGLAWCLVWLMEPKGEGVLSADVSQDAGADGMSRALGHAPRELKTKLLTTIADDVSWLVKEDTRSCGRCLYER